MNELITQDGLLNNRVAAQIEEFERQIKLLMEQEEELRADILEAMEERGIKSIKTDNLTITYKEPYDREKFDSKAFKAEFPELYDKYISMITVKPSIAIKVTGWN